MHAVLAHLYHLMDSEFEATEGDENITIFEGLVNSRELPGDSKGAEILTVKISSETKHSQKFEGACVDSGAQLSVIGERQADLYRQTFAGEKMLPVLKQRLDLAITHFGMSVFWTFGYQLLMCASLKFILKLLKRTNRSFSV